MQTQDLVDKARRINDANIALIGHPFAPIGMGEHVRSSFRALRDVGCPATIKDIYSLEKRDDVNYETEFAAHIRPGLSQSLNIFHINGDEIEQSVAHINDKAFDGAYNVVYPAWELSKYPECWARQLERFDEVWAPSKFIQGGIEEVVSKPVVHMPLAVEVTISKFLGRRHFSIPDHAFCFLFFFDFGSYMERKNPFAVIEAFLKLVERNPSLPVHCVLKFKGGAQDHPDQKRLNQILRRYSDRIQVISNHLTDNEIKNLIRSCDCFVSLHRSEGFGRGIAEAMTLGRAVITTGYSGNMDFVTPETSWIVNYELIPVKPESYPHWQGQVWADPSIEHAATLMEEIIRNPFEARKRAGAARRHMRTSFSARKIGLRYLDRIGDILEARTAEA